MYDLSLGYGGGVKFGVEPQGTEGSRVEVQTVPIDSNDWIQGLYAAATYGDGGYSEQPDGAAVVLYFDSPPGLSAAWHTRLIAAVGLLVLLTAAIVLMLRQFDWQRARRPATIACKFTTVSTDRLPSIITVAAMLYLTLLVGLMSHPGRCLKLSLPP
jgi:hypothetical protein